MSDEIPLIEAPRSRRPLVIGVVVLVLAVIGAVAFLATRGDDTPRATGDGKSTDLSKDDPVKVVLGTVGASDPYWKTLEDAAADAGIELEIRDFDSYPLPNPALAEGELDANQFQHIVYLAEYNVANNDDLVPLGSTAIYPLGLYSQKYDDVADIPDGETVIVPDDDSNQARGLLVLQSAGLIQLKDGGSIFSTVADVDTAASRVKVKALQADLTATSLPDVAAAVINNDFVEDAGLKFEDAIAVDDPSDPKAIPYVNIFAVRAEDKDNPVLKKLVEVYQQTQAVLDGADEASGGTAQFVTISQADLEASLREVEAQIRDQK
ncbi:MULTISPECIES: MetQ/NlpA family ABC transporter substrate-binding protein [unclassified Nocardioides]|uniref:MetQ/NlpA family ABC transporter substrate-binding protein n=1 Tax=unclassified Nocardioides TaxID=2615069 RepID=UPI000702A348|nr:MULTISPECIES: MetQ/NlpA family ABC transporter substrate-binding protein [unclassified Nocardioides]KRC52654.1 methionine ABC transporter substrate-binding protein [Nocardioides sp. Root79]KRC72186.1 methionine ABC transporter substrate-binding protein [Nocardioides sp. Root240]